MSPNRRYLIVGTGRTGSTLLASILAQSGANFEIPAQDDWERDSGAMEHPRLHQAYNWFSRSRKISESILPNWPARKFCRSRARSHLEDLMKRAEYAKSSKLIWMVHDVYSLGYQPVIILSYRSFGEYCRSYYQKDGWDFEKLKRVYLNVYRTGLIQLHTFGGCTVSYEELIGEGDEWIQSLSNLTGIRLERLEKSREKKTRPQRFEPLTIQVPNEIQELYRRLKQTRGEIFASVQILE